MSERQWNVNRRGRFRFKTRINWLVVFPSIIWICWIKTSRLACNSKIWKDDIQREECNNNLELAGSRFSSSFSKLRKFCRFFCRFVPAVIFSVRFKVQEFSDVLKNKPFQLEKKRVFEETLSLCTHFSPKFPRLLFFTQKKTFFFTRKTEISFKLKISFYSNRILRQFSCCFLVTKNFEVKILLFSYINWTRVSSY